MSKRSFITNLYLKKCMWFNVAVDRARDFSPRLDAGVPAPGYLYIIEKAE